MHPRDPYDMPRFQLPDEDTPKREPDDDPWYPDDFDDRSTNTKEEA